MKNVKEQIHEFLEIEISELNVFIRNIDFHSLENAKELIIKAEKNNNRIHVTGIGKPAHVASYIASLFSSTGTPTYELNATEAVHGSAGQVLPNDVVIAISNSGETKELKATIQTLKNNEAKIIAVTSNENSWLAKQADVSLIAKVHQEGDSMNKPPRASIVAQIIMLQCLSILLQNTKNITPEQYIKWHPGGMLGESIRKEQI